VIRIRAVWSSIALMLVAWPAAAAAQDKNGSDWSFRAASYVFMADIDGEQSFPAPDDIHVDFSDLIKKTDFSFMGSFEARYKKVGAFADVIYLDLGDKKSDTDRLGTGAGPGVPLPSGITADVKLDVKSWIVTMGAFYTAVQSDSANLDLFAGARMTRTKARVDYAFSDPFGPFTGPAQEGSIGGTTEDWDGIVGTKGRVNFGRNKEWFAVGYGDIGTGDSKRTWQLFVGAGRRFGRFDALIGWRKIAYRYKSDSPIEGMSYSGPLIGTSLSF
jgi:hypothetical protein